MEKAWEDYRAKVVPQGADKAQVLETRKAFYAGAYSFHTAMIEGLSPGLDCEDGDLDLVDDMVGELEEWIGREMAKAARG